MLTLTDGSDLLKTWFPIVVETMWCADFRFVWPQRWALRFLIVAPFVAPLVYVASHIAWSDIAAAIWIP